MSKTSLFVELRRRQVYRVAVAYAVVGWLLIEIATQVFPVFHMPDWAAQLVVLLIVIGFPIAVLLAWAFEMTPEGVRRTQSADSPQARPPEQRRHVGRKLDFVIIAVLAIAVAGLTWRQFGPHASAPNKLATAAGIGKSIAVLPFENLSSDKNNAYFADGIQDEILTSLAKIRELKVISRTSTRSYGSQPDNVPQIARELGVATILEGSVQRAGNRVRVNVQLIEAATDSHLWAETYDRSLDDVFAVQSEVAQKIARSLRATLTRNEREALAHKPTTNTEAYTAYLRGRALNEISSYDRASTAELLATYRRAVELDPGFALAWAELVKLNIFQYWEGYASGDAGLEAARAALQKAQALAPSLPQVHIARGWFLYYGERQFSAALEAFRAAQQGLPNNDQAFVGAALVERRLSRWQDAIRDLERARELNPNGLEILTILGESLIAQRQFARAENALDAGLALKPSDPFLLDMKATCLFNSHREWSEIDRTLTGFPDTAASLGSRATSALYQRRYDEASALFERAIAATGLDDSPDNYKDYIPTPTALRLGLALSERRRGKPESAISVYRTIKTNATAALASNPDHTNVRAALHAVRGMAEAGLGESRAAVVDGERAAALIPEASDAIDGPAWQRYLARIHALDGDAERALPLLAHLLSITTTDPQTTRLLEIDPIWDPLRKDPRFQALLESDSRE